MPELIRVSGAGAHPERQPKAGFLNYGQISLVKMEDRKSGECDLAATPTTVSAIQWVSRTRDISGGRRVIATDENWLDTLAGKLGGKA